MISVAAHVLMRILKCRDNNDSSNTSSPSHLWTITEQKAASDPEDMTIIINLGHKKNKKADSDATDATHVHLE